jgi:hypothetical protein
MLELLMMLGGVLLFPWLLLGFLLWMAWVEDSLPAAVRRSERTPDPAPILAFPVGPPEAAPAPVPAVPAVPEQRQAPAAQADEIGAEVGADVGAGVVAEVVAEPAQASEVSRSTEPSLGGSTNR